MLSPFHLRSVFKIGEQFLNLLRFKAYFEPCVPDGCAESIVTDAPGLEAFGIPSLRGCCVTAFEFPAPP
jgi:hypothetical protein